jgi:hypothetical protein
MIAWLTHTPALGGKKDFLDLLLLLAAHDVFFFSPSSSGGERLIMKEIFSFFLA